MSLRRVWTFLFLTSALVSPAVVSPALAKDDATEGVNPSPATVVETKRSYTPADFARFAPRSALDMLRQIPGFSINEGEQARGLGQASGNVLVNSQRLSSKSDDIFAQLSRIPASNVERIELVDAATLKVPGLTGVVANVVAKTGGFSGQFAWSPQFRAHYAHPSLLDGSISVSGKLGSSEYSLSLVNDANRGAAGGPTEIHDANGALRERREDVLTFDRDAPKLSGSFKFKGPGSGVGNVNLSYQRVWERTDELSLRDSVAGQDRTRLLTARTAEWYREIGGDYEFKLGPGRMKVIGLDRRSQEPYSQSLISTPSDGTPPSGDSFAQTGERNEHILRGEYSWHMLGGDWQLASEAAFNRLAIVSTLGTLNAGGAFDITPFPDGSGAVKEDRYEASISVSQPITRKLNLQVIAGAERSTLALAGANGLTRNFVRPKGSVSLAWKPWKGFDANVKLRRRVLQLSFYDFLARRFLDNGNANTGNNQLVPQQDWTLEGEVNKSLGAWGSTKLHFIAREVQDYVAVVPIAGGGESVGNVPKAHVRFLESVSTLNLDAIGWKGAKIDMTAFIQSANYIDPLTARKISYSGMTDRALEINLRHDIPGSNWAWGGEFGYFRNTISYRMGERGHDYEGPYWGALFIENKNVAGLTLRFQANNLLGARQHWDRVVFTGDRDLSPVAFTETRDRLIGPIFTFSVKGSF